MSTFMKNNKGELIEYPPYLCKMCGLYEIELEHDICLVCRWEDDVVQNRRPDFEGGANYISYNQYKNIWETYKDEILAEKRRLRSRFIHEKMHRMYPEVMQAIPKPHPSVLQAAKEKEVISEYEEEKLRKKRLLIRNDFKRAGAYGMPLIKKQDIDLSKIELWGYTKTKLNDHKNCHKTIHFFAHDWKYDTVFDKPDIAMEKLDQYYALLTPDFSLYWDMPRAVQIYSVFKNRWCGAYWQSQGKIVIPTITCGLEDSYDFVFDGIEQGSVVAVSTYRRERYERECVENYHKILEVIKPSAVICYGEPFSGMDGNIIPISPYNKEALIAKLGLKEFTKRMLAGELYPDN
ncbi:MAG: DUF4417 domain-containing protein [Firmicutes bacterium]|nr:DUF4417 domain-containing protein [Bacillota bacterium]